MLFRYTYKNSNKIMEIKWFIFHELSRTFRLKAYKKLNAIICFV